MAWPPVVIWGEDWGYLGGGSGMDCKVTVSTNDFSCESQSMCNKSYKSENDLGLFSQK